ncbi:MAG: tRNA (N6-isopentenyl adenosine(37)-C2)-methylthiotransferase MiaB [Oscillospiraceae bacterium]|jgi:tRNA-2-methylthio-N6-dimethylallyladenosine synthase|nr:tRNA (N6-isopentenyl adenosine(37)-C2)-methylthiotransferase MiaB [Oscillospiraceae bacterium]
MSLTVEKFHIQEQKDIMARVKSANAAQNRAKYARVLTFGCQQNEADSERIRGMLDEMGYAMTETDDGADVIVINTCAVREHAEAKVFGVIGALTHLKRAKPGLIIAVCGCMAQRPEVSERIRESYKHVDIVFGTHALWRFPELLETAVNGGERVFSVENSDGEIAEGLPALRGRKYTAWLPVMYGCNNFCTYCIVPYVRGRERSRGVATVISDSKELIASGARDITLLGQNVNSYKPAGETDFPQLLRELNDLDGDFLLRFMTSHPKDAGERLFAAMADSPKVARHLHLPFQSGSNRILKLMNRGYTREHYLELIAAARSAMPDLVLTSDVIVGFPGETEADFEETYNLIKEVRFDALFTFIHSARPGAPSAKLDDPVPRETKQVWFDRMIELQNGVSAEKHAEYVGKTLRVLVDTETGDALYPFSGRTNGNRLVRLHGDAALGEFADVKITDCNTWSLIGEMTTPRA